MPQQSESESGISVETSTAVVTVVCIIAGAVLIALGHAEYGAPLLTFAVGASATKPLLRSDR